MGFQFLHKTISNKRSVTIMKRQYVCYYFHKNQPPLEQVDDYWRTMDEVVDYLMGVWRGRATIEFRTREFVILSITITDEECSLCLATAVK